MICGYEDEGRYKHFIAVNIYQADEDHTFRRGGGWLVRRGQDQLQEGDPRKCDPVSPDPAGGDDHHSGLDPGQHRHQDQGAGPRQRSRPHVTLGVQGQRAGHLGGQGGAGEPDLSQSLHLSR